MLFLPTAAGLPTNLNGVQVNLTSFRVSWTPPATVTGYRMYWNGGGGYDSGNMSVGAEDRAVTITDHTPGLTYNITIVALSDHLPSPTVGVVMLTLGEPHMLTGSVGCIDITLCSLYAEIVETFWPDYFSPSGKIPVVW